MAIAWTTILIITLLLPGVAVFVGLAIFERVPREVVRSNVVSEVGLAVLFAVVIHTVCISILTVFGFDLRDFAAPLALHDRLRPDVLVASIVDRLLQGVGYTIVTTLIGFGAGALLALGVVSGKARFIATHKWIYDVINSDRKGGVVTAYVMTTACHEGKTLMYRGRLQEFFLTQDGKLSYVVLRNCSRYFMTFDGDHPSTGDHVKLFGRSQDHRPLGSWDYLMIEGSNIANVLFDPSPEVKQTDAGDEALRAALEQVRQYRLRARRVQEDREIEE